MNNYIREYIKHNLKKCFIMILMIVVCLTLTLFTLEIIINLTNEMNSTLKDKVSKEDMKTMILLFRCGIALILGICYLIVDNTYAVIIHGREKEFNVLSKLGIAKKKIKLMLSKEACILGIFASIVSVFTSKILSALILQKFEFIERKNIGINVYVIVILLVVFALNIIISRNVNRISIGLNQKKKKIKFINKKKILLMRVYGISGILMIILSFLEPIIIKAGYGDNLELIQTLLFGIGICLAIDYVIYGILVVFRKISDKYKIVTLYIANEQCLYNFYQIKSVMNAVLLAVMLFVGFQGMFESIKETTRKYVNESVNYDYMVIINDKSSKPHISEVNSLLENRKTKDKLFAIALTIETIGPNGKVQLFTGIDEDYYKLQRLYVVDEGNINNIYNEDNLYVLYSSKKANQKNNKVGDVIKDYTYNGKVFDFKIGALYDPINLIQAFTSRSNLSMKLWNNTEQYNAIYFRNYTISEVQELMKELGIDKYKNYNMADVREDAVDKSLNGTELIEALLYVSIFCVASLVVNIFVLSLDNRIKEFREMLILGANKKVLLCSMLIESTIIFIGGSIIGYILGIPFIEGVLFFIEKELIFETVVVVPYLLVAFIVTCSFLGVLLCTYMIGKRILHGNILEYNYRE